MVTDNVKNKSYLLAVAIVKYCRVLAESKKEFVLSRQLMRSGTSIGANIREAQDAQSPRDFVHKLSISQKECGETLFWLELLKDTELMSASEFEPLHNQALQVKKLLASILITKKKNMTLNAINNEIINAIERK